MSGKMVTFSIVIPAYNEERHLADCLESIAAQTVRPHEVIVVDNNSTDRTAEIARRYTFVQVVRERRQGIVFARGAGFDAATGDVLVRIDADDVLPLGWLAKLQQFYANPKHVQIVVTGRLQFYNFHFPRLFGMLHGLLVQRASRLLLGHYFPGGSNSAMPKTAWLAVRTGVCERTDIHEDIDLGLHLNQAGYHIRYYWSCVAGVCMHRVAENHAALGGYLAMWPRTYRVHRQKSWLMVWLFVGAVWIGSWVIFVVERLSGSVRHR